MTKRMTVKQRVSRYVKNFDGPTVADMCRSLNLSQPAVSEAVKQLREEGILITESRPLGGNIPSRYYPATAAESADPERAVVTRMALFDRCISQARGKGGVA
jgi:DNA-binding transcriptional ArsR family regulator